MPSQANQSLTNPPIAKQSRDSRGLSGNAPLAQRTDFAAISRNKGIADNQSRQKFNTRVFSLLRSIDSSPKKLNKLSDAINDMLNDKTISDPAVFVDIIKTDILCRKMFPYNGENISDKEMLDRTIRAVDQAILGHIGSNPSGIALTDAKLDVLKDFNVNSTDFFARAANEFFPQVKINVARNQQEKCENDLKVAFGLFNVKKGKSGGISHDMFPELQKTNTKTREKIFKIIESILNNPQATRATKLRAVILDRSVREKSKTFYRLTHASPTEGTIKHINHMATSCPSEMGADLLKLRDEFKKVSNRLTPEAALAFMGGQSLESVLHQVNAAKPVRRPAPSSQPEP